MSEALHPLQVEGFRRMTPAQKLRMVADLYDAGIRLRMAGLRMAHPDWPEERLEYEARRRRIELEGSGAWIAPPEYVIVRKLEFLREGGSDKHARDIRFIVAATALERSFLETQIARLGLQEQWRRCQP